MTIKNTYTYDTIDVKLLEEFILSLYSKVKKKTNLELDYKTVLNEIRKMGLSEADLENGQPKSIPLKMIEEFYRDMGIKNKSADELADETHVFFNTDADFLFGGNSILIGSKIKNDNDINLGLHLDSKHFNEGLKSLTQFLTNFLGSQCDYEILVKRDFSINNVVISIANEHPEIMNAIKDYIVRELPYALINDNPFIMTIDGVGFSPVGGVSNSSYIGNQRLAYSSGLKGVASLIAEIINYLKKNRVSDTIFLNEFKKIWNKCVIDESAYKKLFEGTGEYKYFKSSVYDVPPKVEDKNHKKEIFLSALRYTYEKHGIEWIRDNLSSGFSGDYHWISRGNGRYSLRALMIENVSGLEFNQYYEEILAINNFKKNEEVKSNELTEDTMIFSKIDEEIINQKNDLFIDAVFGNENIVLLEQTSLVTLNKHGNEQLAFAINEFVKRGIANGFTRFKSVDDKVNYREYLNRFNQESIIKTMMKSLGLRGIDTSVLSLEDIINVYTDILSNSLDLGATRK
ncbi:MAG: hypothetical protein IJA94_06020 [Bacilli bacterium]|nr:hypothetical protein [Bacilli bacterium]